MLKIIVFALVVLFLVIFLRDYRPDYAAVLLAVAGGILLIVTLKEIYTPLDEFLTEMQEYGVSKELTVYLLKALGICYITRFAAELCGDFGQSSLASKVELAGRGAIFILSLPIIRSVLNLGLSLLKE